jgi:hypothetical protein
MAPTYTHQSNNNHQDAGAGLCFIADMSMSVEIPKVINSDTDPIRLSCGGDTTKRLKGGAARTTSTSLNTVLQYCTFQVVTEACASFSMRVATTPDSAAAHEPSPLSLDQQRGPRHRPAWPFLAIAVPDFTLPQRAISACTTNNFTIQTAKSNYLPGDSYLL